MTLKRWQDWGNVILGAWMIASPWALGFAVSDNIAALTSWIFGAAIVLFAALAVYMHKVWEEAINIVLGFCLLASPWALGFVNQMTPATNAALVGLLVTALGLWSMLMEAAVQKWWREHYGAHS